MASKKASNKKSSQTDDKKGYQPKATARHARITRTKEEEIEAFKKKIDTDRYLAKKYESNRKTEIKALPKEERSAAKAELKESIAQRKESELKDREKLRRMTREEKAEKRSVGKEPFDEEEWVKGGKKKGKNKEDAPAPSEPEEVSAEDVTEPEPDADPGEMPEEVPEQPDGKKNDS